MAGASMKDIKLRIRSVESTMQITKAMQLVATSKLRRAKERMEQSRPYADISMAAMRAALCSCTDESVSYVRRREVKKRCYVVIAGDRGLAGGYNNNIFKLVAAHSEGIDYCVLPLGRKAVEKYQRVGVQLISDDYPRVEGITVGMCYKLAKLLTDGFLTEKFDEIYLAFTNFQNMLSQNATVEKLLPLDKPENAEEHRLVSTVYDPDPQTTLERVVPDFLAGHLYSALCNSYASEVSARRTAMDSATKNAGAMISDLRLRYNRARQGAITQEITEIVAGAEK